MSTSNKENQINTPINDGRKPLSSIINKPNNNTTHDQAKQPLKNNNNNNRSVLTNNKIPPFEMKNDLSIEKERIIELELQLKKKEEFILQLQNQLLNVKDEKIEELELQLKLKEDTILQLENQILNVKDESNLQLEIKNQLLNEKDEKISKLSSDYEDLKELFIYEVLYKNENNDKINSIQNNRRIRMIHKLKTENNELKEKRQHDHQHQNQHQHQHHGHAQHQSSTINNNYYIVDHVEHVGEC